MSGCEECYRLLKLMWGFKQYGEASGVGLAMVKLKTHRDTCLNYLWCQKLGVNQFTGKPEQSIEVKDQ